MEHLFARYSGCYWGPYGGPQPRKHGLCSDLWFGNKIAICPDLSFPAVANKAHENDDSHVIVAPYGPLISHQLFAGIVTTTQRRDHGQIIQVGFH